MATSVGPSCTISKFCSDLGMRPGEQERLLGRNLGPHDLDDVGGQMTARIERGKAARRQQALEAAIACEERALIILHDDLEHETLLHDTYPLP